MDHLLKRKNFQFFVFSILVYNLVIFIYTGNFYDKTKNRLMQEIDEKLLLGAKTVQYLLSSDFHDRTNGPDAISSEEDQRNRKLLSEYANLTGFRYLYSILQDGDRYFFTSSNVTADDIKSQKLPYYYQSFDEASEDTKKAFLGNLPVFQTSTDRWGTFRTALIPIRSPGGRVYLAGADYDIGYVNSLLWHQLIQSIILACLLLVIPCPFIFFYHHYQKRFLSGLQNINHALTIDIEDCKYIEHVLRDSEELYRNYFEEGLIGMAIVSPEQGWIECNKRLCTMLGYSNEELERMTWADVTYPGDLDICTLEYDRLLTGEINEYNLDKRYIRKDGEILYVKLYVRGMYDSEGRMKHIIAHMQDITSQKVTEAALKESQENYKEIFNAANEAIFIHDFETGKILDVNQTMLDMYGFPYEEALHIGPDDTSSGEPMYCQSAALAWIEKSKNEGPQIFEWHAKRKNGELFWVEVNLKTALIGNKKRIIAVVRDITCQMNALEALKKSEGLYRALTENSWDMTAIINREGIYQYTSPSIKKYLGYEPSEIVNQAVGFFCHPDDCLQVKRVFNAVQQHPEICLTLNNIRIRHKNGQYVNVDGFVSYLCDVPGINGIVFNGRDATEQRKVETELLKSKKLESIGILAGGIAHDFNNLLTAILGNISMAKNFSESNSRVVDRLSEAEKASMRAKGLTQQLLTFSKGGDPVKETSSLKELVKETAMFIMSGSNVRCEFEISDDLWLVDIDRGQISQVIQNLVINANQSMPEGGVIRITARNIHVNPSMDRQDLALLDGDYVQLMIEDQGVGIPEDHLDMIFDPYFSTKEQGNGLGLATVYSIIHKHDGVITVQSIVNKGTTFTLYLPGNKKIGNYQSEIILENSSPGFHAKILLLDDEEFVRDIVCEMLVTLGYDVICASEGKEAVEIYRSHLSSLPFDLVILDLTIPGGMGGKEAMEEMRKMNPSLKALVSSGYSNDPIMANYQSYGFCGVIGKPFRYEDLQRLIHSVLHN